MYDISNSIIWRTNLTFEAYGQAMEVKKLKIKPEELAANMTKFIEKLESELVLRYSENEIHLYFKPFQKHEFFRDDRHENQYEPQNEGLTSPTTILQFTSRVRAKNFEKKKKMNIFQNFSHFL